MFKRLVNYTIAVTKGKGDWIVIECTKEVYAKTLKLALLIYATCKYGKDFYSAL